MVGVRRGTSNAGRSNFLPLLPQALDLSEQKLQELTLQQVMNMQQTQPIMNMTTPILNHNTQHTRHTPLHTYLASASTASKKKVLPLQE